MSFLFGWAESMGSQAAWVSFNKNPDQGLGDMYKMRVQTTVYQEEP